MKMRMGNRLFIWAREIKIGMGLDIIDVFILS